MSLAYSTRTVSYPELYARTGEFIVLLGQFGGSWGYSVWRDGRSTVVAAGRHFDWDLHAVKQQAEAALTAAVVASKAIPGGSSVVSE